MKKITKKNLDELAKTMPVIDVVTQQQYAAGTKYFDLSGMYLGQIGHSDDLRFCGAYDFQLMQANNDENGGITFASLSNISQNNFISMRSSAFAAASIGRTSKYDAGLTENGTLAINPNSAVWLQLSSVDSTINHEEYHYRNEHYILTGVALHLAEVNTYVNQASSSGYIYTSNEYRQMAADGLWEHWDKLGLTHTTGYTVSIR